MNIFSRAFGSRKVSKGEMGSGLSAIVHADADSARLSGFIERLSALGEALAGPSRFPGTADSAGTPRQPVLDEIERAIAGLEAACTDRQSRMDEGASRLGEARRIIPFAQAVLRAVPSQTEEAAFGLMEKFQGVRDVSAQSASSAHELEALLDGSSGHVSVSTAAEHTRDAVQREKKTITGIAAFNQENEKGLHLMSKEIDSGIELLKGIEEINERSRLIAFNLAIEAAHIGDRGKGFKIIAGELRTLNAQSADISRKVADMLLRFRDSNAVLVKNVSERSEKIIADVETGMGAAEEAVESLIGASQATTKFAREMSAYSRTIDQDLDGVLESLQFQDITRQMVEGVGSMVAEMKLHLEALSPLLGPDGKGSLGEIESLRDRLLSASKTKGEKDAIMGVNA